MLAFAEELVQDIFVEESAVAMLVNGTENSDEEGQEGQNGDGNGKDEGFELFFRG